MSYFQIFYAILTVRQGSLEAGRVVRAPHHGALRRVEAVEVGRSLGRVVVVGGSRALGVP